MSVHRTEVYKQHAAADGNHNMIYTLWVGAVVQLVEYQTRN